MGASGTAWRRQSKACFLCSLGVTGKPPLRGPPVDRIEERAQHRMPHYHHPHHRQGNHNGLRQRLLMMAIAVVRPIVGTVIG